MGRGEPSEGRNKSKRNKRNKRSKRTRAQHLQFLSDSDLGNCLCTSSLPWAMLRTNVSKGLILMSVQYLM